MKSGYFKSLTGIIFLISSECFSQAAFPVYEPFNYLAGTILAGQGGWINNNTGDEMRIVSGSLFYSEVTSSNNKVAFGLSGKDPQLVFTSQPNGSKIYYSFLLNVVNSVSAGTTGGNFIGLGSSTLNFGATIWLKQSSSGHYKIGLSPRDLTAQIVWSTAEFSYNSTHFVTSSYELRTGSTSNDIVKLWIDPILNTSEPSANISITNSAGTDLTLIDRLYLRQQGVNADSLEVDEIYISNNWSETTLPVELSSFSVNKTALGAKLIWSTATETNNNGFAIERSSDKAAWSQIGFVAGKGTTTEKQTYSFVDSKASGTVYYRLKQIDNDGKTSFSSVETVTLVAEKFELLNNTPNPFNPSTTIRFALPAKAFVRVSVSNILGQEVAVLANQEFDANPNHQVLFDASKLTSGIYFYTVTTNGKSLTKSMTLMK